MNSIFQSIAKFFRSLFGYTENTQNPVIQTNVPTKKIDTPIVSPPDKKDVPVIVQPEPQTHISPNQGDISSSPKEEVTISIEVPTDTNTDAPKEDEVHISTEVPQVEPPATEDTKIDEIVISSEIPKNEDVPTTPKEEFGSSAEPQVIPSNPTETPIKEAPKQEVIDHQPLADSAPALNLQIERYSFGEKDTLGKFYINGKFYSYTLEDVHPSKGKSIFAFNGNGENGLYFNCIPAGLYELVLRTTGGGMHTTYTLKYPDMHKGMLSLLNVPKIPYVFFQIGSSEADTKGCIIVGEKIIGEENITQERGIQGSEDAYSVIYPLVADYLVKGGKVYLTITDAGLK